MYEHSALAAAARLGLDDAASLPVVLEDCDVGTVLDAAARDRTSGLLWSAIKAGHVEAGEDVAAAVFEQWRIELSASVLVEGLAVRAARVLDDGHVRWRLTKGPAVTHLDYAADVALRCFGDVDIVIHPDDWGCALAAFATTAHRRATPELRPRFDARFGKGATILDDDDLEIDLHRRFAIGRFGIGARMGELFRDADTIELGGRSMPALAGADRLLHACHHAVLGGFSAYRAVRDVAQLLLVSDVDWRATVDRAASWRAGAVVSPAIRTTWTRLALTRPHAAHEWALAHPPPAVESRALDVFAAERPFREQALTAIPVLGWRRRPAYLAALAFPRLPGRSAVRSPARAVWLLARRR